MWGQQCAKRTRISFICSPSCFMYTGQLQCSRPRVWGWWPRCTWACWGTGGRRGEAAHPREDPLPAGCKEEVCLLWELKDGRKPDLSQVGDSHLKKTIQQVQMPCGLKDLGAQGPNLSEGSRAPNKKNGVGSRTGCFPALGTTQNPQAAELSALF